MRIPESQRLYTSEYPYPYLIIRTSFGCHRIIGLSVPLSDYPYPYPDYLYPYQTIRTLIRTRLAVPIPELHHSGPASLGGRPPAAARGPSSAGSSTCRSGKTTPVCHPRAVWRRFAPVDRVCCVACVAVPTGAEHWQPIKGAKNRNDRANNRNYASRDRSSASLRRRPQASRRCTARRRCTPTGPSRAGG